MTPEQALEILRQVAAMAAMPLQGHQQAQQALDILAAIQKEKKDE